MEKTCTLVLENLALIAKIKSMNETSDVEKTVTSLKNSAEKLENSTRSLRASMLLIFFCTFFSKISQRVKGSSANTSNLCSSRSSAAPLRRVAVDLVFIRITRFKDLHLKKLKNVSLLHTREN